MLVISAEHSGRSKFNDLARELPKQPLGVKRLEGLEADLAYARRRRAETAISVLGNDLDGLTYVLAVLALVRIIHSFRHLE